jgi:hypothetical protein
MLDLKRLRWIRMILMLKKKERKFMRKEFLEHKLKELVKNLN